MDITGHYDLLNEDEPLIDTLVEALALAGNDEKRVWFVRHGDGDQEEGEEDVWFVEPLADQFVNRMGYFVTAQPCLPEHIGQVLTY